MDEKFVSIEYSKWHSYYKPLEELNQQLTQELARLKEENKINIYLSVRGTRYPYLENVGFITAGVDLPHTQVKINGREIIGAMNLAIESETGSFRYSSSKPHVFSYNEAEEFSMLHQKYHQALKDLDKERAAFRKEVRAIPRWKRWLFKIKTPKI